MLFNIVTVFTLEYVCRSTCDLDRRTISHSSNLKSKSNNFNSQVYITAVKPISEKLLLCRQCAADDVLSDRPRRNVNFETYGPSALEDNLKDVTTYNTFTLHITPATVAT